MAEDSTTPLQSQRKRFHRFRYVVAILLFTGVVSTFMMRVNLSVAIVSMVKASEEPLLNSTSGSNTCTELQPPAVNRSLVSTSQVQGSYDWDIKTQSWILGSFFYGYALFQLPCSILVQHFNSKWLFGVAILVTSVVTLLTPIAAELGADIVVAARILQGIVQGVVFPAVYLLVARWSPLPERDRTFTFVASGSAVGNIVGMSISGVLANSTIFGGWPSTFYITGGFGCLWFVLWVVFAQETPSQSPWMSSREKDYLEDNLSNNKKKQNSGVPWIPILKSVPMWAYVVALLGHSLGLFIVMTEMPTYLSNILHFDIKMNGVLCALPFFLQTVFGLASGHLADILRRHCRLSNTAIRKIINSIGNFGSGACITLVGVVGCRTAPSIALLCLSAGLNAVCYAGCVITCVEMSPIYSATMLGISLSVSNLAGAAAPYLVGEFTSSGQTVENWTKVFAVTGAIMIATGIVFNLFGNAEVQPWNPQTAEDRPEEISPEKLLPDTKEIT